MARPYENVQLGFGRANDPALVRALQQDLRALGYLLRGIDGAFGDGTRAAVRHLQYDLLNNNGSSFKNNGARAPVAIKDYNKGVASPPTGATDAALAQSIEALLDDPAVIQVPAAADPASVNAQAMRDVAGAGSAIAPLPFMLAMFVQESSCDHYVVPESAADQDRYLTIVLDFNDKLADGSYSPDHVTSRGYGLGQFTYFHHPLSRAEADGVFGSISNAQLALVEFASKFRRFVVGPDDVADDYKAEHAVMSLNVCRYPVGDTRRLSDCQACAVEVPKKTLTPATLVYPGATETYGDAKFDAGKTFWNVPDRAAFQCAWPYAARRYNGGNADSYHYQATILLSVLAGLPAIPPAPAKTGS